MARQNVEQSFQSGYIDVGATQTAAQYSHSPILNAQLGHQDGKEKSRGMRLGVWFGCLFWLLSYATAQAQDIGALQKALGKREAAFIVKDLQTGAFLRLNESRCQEQFPPFATIEIPLALIALDAKIARNLDSVIPWNRLKYPLRETENLELSHWPEDHTLRSAFLHSVEWYWLETAERIGTKRLEISLQQMGYGNAHLPTAMSQLLQNGPLGVSAQTQADFIEHLALGELPIAPVAQRNFKELLLRERGTNYQLYVKLGGGLLSDGRYLNWNIGWIETGAGKYSYAFNVTHKDLQTAHEIALELPKRLLLEAGFWPQPETGKK